MVWHSSPPRFSAKRCSVAGIQDRGQASTADVRREPGTSHSHICFLINASSPHHAACALPSQMFECFQSACSKDSSQLCRFVLLTFADLKAQKYVYWFAHPVLIPDAPFTLSRPPQTLMTVLSADRVTALFSSLEALRASHGGSVPPCFGIHVPTNTAVSLHDVAMRRYDTSELWFGFVDPCPLDANPGWPLRCVNTCILT